MKSTTQPRVRRVAVETLENRQLLHAPAIDAIASQTVPVGKTLQVPITATYDHPDALFYTVTDSSGALIEQFRPNSNTWLQMDVAGFGTMKFQLFNDLAPDTVRRITGLVNSGYYDGLTFHRVIDDFIIQGGDPKGDGTGGPNFTFDDEFNASATFTGDGQLAMANSGKDTNGSQFFVTEGTTRFLDFNHTIFGQLVRGKSVRDLISEVATNANGMPQSVVTITSMKIIQNTTDAVLQIKGSSVGSGTVTVTATGAEGTSSRSFTVSSVTDTDPNADTPPILTSLNRVYYTPVATPITIPFSSLDVEGTAVEYPVQYATLADEQIGAGIVYTAGSSGITVTPPAGYSGPIKLYIGVKTAGATGRGSSSSNPNQPLSGIADAQLITIAVGDKSATSAGATLDAPAGAATTNVVVATFVDADKSAGGSTWSATIDWGDNTVEAGTVVKTAAGEFSVLGTHAYRQSGQFPVTVDIKGNLGALTRATGVITARDFATLGGSTVTVQGGSGNDVIGISKKGTKFNVNVNGVIKQYNAAQVSRFDVYGYAGGDLLALGAGVPGSYLFGDVGDDTLQGGDFNDTLTGAGGKNFMYGNAGNDRINGSSGRDYAYGGLGEDRIYGGGGGDYLEGNAGVDRIWAGDGDDFIVGGSGNDKLYGELGANTIVGNAGADILDGTFGVDTSDNDSADTRINIEMFL